MAVLPNRQLKNFLIFFFLLLEKRNLNVDLTCLFLKVVCIKTRFVALINLLLSIYPISGFRLVAMMRALVPKRLTVIAAILQH